MTASPPDQPPAASPDSVVQATRRTGLIATVAVGAALAGGGLAWWWRGRQGDASAPAAQQLPDQFWTLRWDTPHGQPLAMAGFQGKPLLLNFWATWCTPCVEELPLLNDFYRANKDSGWQILALAVDRLEPVRGFLRQMPLDFPVGMAGSSGSELGRSLGNLVGGLPFSVVVGQDGFVLARKLGKLKPTDLDRWRQLK